MSYRNCHELFLDRVRKSSRSLAFKFKQHNRWIEVTWEEMASRVRNVALSLLQLGLRKEDKVCILGDTRWEWDTLDRASHAIGAITVGVYQTLIPEQVAYIVGHSDAKLVLVQDRTQLDKVLEHRKELDQLKHIVVMEMAGCEQEDVIPFDELLRPPEKKRAQLEKLLEKQSASVGPDDLATLIYTSGTTGPPKGAMLSHGNLIAEAEMLRDVVAGMGPDDVALVWLPNSHIFQRAATMAGIQMGIRAAYAESMDQLLENLAEIRPTLFYSVPRLYERAYGKMQSQVKAAGGLKKLIFDACLLVGRSYSSHLQKREPVPVVLELLYFLARYLVFDRITQLFGGRIKLVASSGAPISKEILEFFHAAGLLTLEAYGMTESTGAITANRENAYRFGTVGRACKGVELRIAEDGEVLARAPVVFKGYYKAPELTAEALDGDGWYHTGDVGVIDEDGFLRITDRKKDIIITAGGKNVAPQNIENMLKESLYVSQAMVYGDRKPYLVALITLALEEIQPYAREQGISGNDLETLSHSPLIRTLIQREVDAVNARLARFETIKKFHILPVDLTQEDGDLTPTLKVKRKVVTVKYKDVLDVMYEQ